MNYLLKEQDGRRIFNDSTIQAAIDDALGHVSEDVPIAAVAHATPLGQRLSLAIRLDGKWSISVAAYRAKRYDDKWTHGVGAEVVWTPINR